MQLLAHCKGLRHAGVAVSRILLIMKLLSFLLMIALHASARTYSQEISISLTDAHLETVFRQIRKQTHYKFIYTREQLRHSRPVTVNVKQAPVTVVLDICFRDQPLTYVLEENVVIIRIKEKPAEPANIAAPVKEINGRITNEQGEPLAGVTIALKGTNKAVASNEKGEFRLDTDDVDATLVITSIGYQRQEVKLQGRSNLLIVMKAELSNLDETVVIAYGSTTRRFNTGSVSKLTAEEISKQPVSNPLATLQGRIPGLVVTSTSGIPGSTFVVQIRGQNTVNSTPPTAGLPIKPDQPLFIIDGVPFAPQNNRVNQFSSILSPVGVEIYNNPYGGVSAFNSINPNDIESIEVLRDADATAIYGSRGANGVILITTKRGTSGKTRIQLNANFGFSRVTRTMQLLNTEEYRAMRYEAFRNDGITPTNTLISSSPNYAPDLMIFDSTRYTDWKKFFLGETAKSHDVNISVDGGNNNTRFLISAGFRNESYIFPGDFGNKRISFKTNLTHKSPDKKFFLDISSSYAYDQNNSAASPNVLQAFTLPPNYPALLDSNNNLVWEYKGVRLADNPLGYLKQKYSAKNYNLLSSLQLGYRLFNNIVFRSSFGLNTFSGNEVVQVPRSSQSPFNNPQSRASFGVNNHSAIIVEPQVEYTNTLPKLKLVVLIGGTYQQSTNNSSQILASNYTNEALLGSASAAGSKTISDSYSQYRYAAIFGRIQLVQSNRYLVNLNGRRDGSSRFGPGKQFGNFGSLGIGWIFSEEKKIKNSLSFLSYGKLRFTYGIAGDDGVGDYQYFSRWGLSSTRTGLSFLGREGYLPINLFNPDFSWSATQKVESSLEFGLWNNRLLATITYYHNKCDNQLVSYRLPSQVGGFDGVTSNFPASVVNRGWELELSTRFIKTQKLEWTSRLNLTLPKNKLASFPGIENTSYAIVYRVGEPLSVLLKNVYLGINDTTGIYKFTDVDRNGVFNGSDFQNVGNLEPIFFGGASNNIRWKKFELDIVLDFRKQTGPNYLAQIYSAFPAGSYGNLPKTFLNRWQKPGDISETSKVTARRFASPAGTSMLLFSRSSGAYSDASFVRLRTLAFSYNIQGNFMRRIRVQSCKLFLHSQNLLTLTRYKGNDPETKSFYAAPPMKTWVFGVQVNL